MSEQNRDDLLKQQGREYAGGIIGGAFNINKVPDKTSLNQEKLKKQLLIRELNDLGYYINKSGYLSKLVTYNPRPGIYQNEEDLQYKKDRAHIIQDELEVMFIQSIFREELVNGEFIRSMPYNIRIYEQGESDFNDKYGYY